MTELDEIVDNILVQMYEEAEPGLDFHDLKENPDEYPEDWYSQHVLSAERQREIVDEHTEGENLTDSEHTSVVFSTILNYGPRSSHS